MEGPAFTVLERHQDVAQSAETPAHNSAPRSGAGRTGPQLRDISLLRAAALPAPALLSISAPLSPESRDVIHQSR